jgi:hypothetical protein
MPISDEALQSPKNSFIAVTGEATVGQAIAALQALGGQPWWHLVVKMDDGSWGITRFSDLIAPLAKMAAASEIRLGGRKGLTTAIAIERDSMETRAAQALARKSPGRLAVVTVGGAPVGILAEGVTRSAAALVSTASLNDLGGKYINLKDYGSILLSSSKPPPAAGGSTSQRTTGRN